MVVWSNLLIYSVIKPLKTRKQPSIQEHSGKYDFRVISENDIVEETTLPISETEDPVAQFGYKLVSPSVKKGDEAVTLSDVTNSYSGVTKSDRQYATQLPFRYNAVEANLKTLPETPKKKYNYKRTSYH